MKNAATILIAVSAILFGVWFCIFCILYPLKYQSEIVEASIKYDVSPSLVASVINEESSFNKDKISKKGAIGLMQLLPTTATYIAEQTTNLFNAKENIDVGVKYLSYLIKKFSDIDTAIFAYNAGEGNVSRWLKEQDVEKLKSCPFPETNAYVEKVKKGIKFYSNRF